MTKKRQSYRSRFMFIARAYNSWREAGSTTSLQPCVLRSKILGKWSKILNFTFS